MNRKGGGMLTRKKLWTVAWTTWVVLSCVVLVGKILGLLSLPWGLLMCIPMIAVGWTVFEVRQNARGLPP